MHGKTGYQWIAYAAEDGIPGNMSFELTRHTSTADALERLRYDNNATASEWSMRLYPYSPEDWQEAKDFEDVGCPFDYPSKISERGPRGGLKFIDA